MRSHLRSQRFIRMFAIVAILAMVLHVPAVSAQTDPTPDGPIDELIEKAETEGQVLVIVQVDESRDKEAVQSIVDGNENAEVTTEFETLPLVALTVDADAIRDLASEPGVVAIQENKLSPTNLASTMPVINGNQVHTLGYTGVGQTVAILDTGIDVDHPFFAGRIVSQACYSNAGGAGDGMTLCPGGGTASTAVNSADAETANCINGTANICDHGSHVAGIAAGANTTGAPGNGVAPGADIIAIQVFTRFDDSGTDTPCADVSRPSPCVLTYDSDQVLALQRVLALDGTFDIAAVNMSLGGGDFSSACDGDSRKPAIDNLLAAGIATVVTSGNSGFLNATGAPGCISTAITVGSTTDADAVSSFSNRGPLLDLFAPGSSVDSAVPDDAWGNMDGTSMAAPHVAGAFAVLRAADTTATVAEMLTALQDTGIPITYDTNMAGTTTHTTPRINLLAALGEFVTDNAAPTSVSIIINAGATWTNNANVTLALAASDNFGISRYRLAETQAGLGSATDVTVNPAEPTFARAGVAFTLTGGQDASKAVWLRVYDAAGNATDASDTIGLDTEAPVVTAPPDMQVTAPSADPIVVTYPDATATDNLSGVASGYPQCVPPSGSLFPVGDTIVTCSALDNANNLGTDTFTITVVRDSIQACLFAGSLSQVSPLPYGTPVSVTCGRGTAIVFYQGLDFYSCNYAGSLSQLGTSIPTNCGRGLPLSIAAGVDYWGCMFAGSLTQVGTNVPNCSRGVLVGLERTV